MNQKLLFPACGDSAAHSVLQAAWARGAVYPPRPWGYSWGHFFCVIGLTKANQSLLRKIRLRPRASSTLQALPCTGPRRPPLRREAPSEPRRARGNLSRSGTAGAISDTHQSSLSRRCQRHRCPFDVAPLLAVLRTSHSQRCIRQIGQSTSAPTLGQSTRFHIT